MRLEGSRRTGIGGMEAGWKRQTAATYTIEMCSVLGA
jgi:hypothetical protein